MDDLGDVPPPATEGVEKYTILNEDLPREALLRQTRNIIVSLGVDKDEAFSEEVIIVLLSEARDMLEILKIKYPEEPDIYLFEEALSDLEGDFREGVETELDESMDEMMNEMRAVVRGAGVEQKSVKEVLKEDSLTGKTLRQMRDLGIDVEYVVEAADPNAPVIVLFMQVHARPEGAENVKTEKASQNSTTKKGISNFAKKKKTEAESQLAIYEHVKALIEAGVGSTLYEEFLPEYMKLSEKGAAGIIESQPRFEGAAALELKLDLGEDIVVRGYDNDELKAYLLNGGGDFLHRLTSANVYLASNLASIHPGRDEQPVSFVTIGGLHEQYPKKRVKHQIPASYAMAYYGFNVIVVNQAFN